MYRTTALFIGLAAVVGLSACGSSNESAGTDTTPDAAGQTVPARQTVPDTATPLTGATTDTGAPTDETTVPTTRDTTPTTTGDTTAATIPAADVTVLTGRQWLVSSFITVGGLNDAPASSGASIEFDSEDHVLVDTGCNTGSASVVIDGDQFSIGPIALTKKACAQDAMDLEAHIVSLLQEPSYWSVDGDSLKVYPANITDTGIIFRDGDVEVAPPETFQTTS